MSDSQPQPDRLQAPERVLAALREARAKLEAAERAIREPIAVIGVGCRFPGGVDGPEAYWQMLRDGVDAVAEFPADRYDVDTWYDPRSGTPGKISTRYGAFLSEFDQFDPEFFGISPREAVSLDPQQRLLLEVAWETLENAGQNPHALSGSRTGVFVGSGQTDYAHLQLQQRDPRSIDVYLGTGSGLCYGPGRLAHFLGLRGPNMAIDTACSSSLISVHQACQSLRLGECDLALAGGTHMALSPLTWVFLSASGALAPDGRCKAFDAAADGFGRGEGCGLILLRRLSDALAREDNILALIRGSAVNHDGTSSGLTVPNEAAQQRLLQEALDRTRTDPSAVGYVEAHGTGTRLGDPIEVGALGAVLGAGRSRREPLWIGSVKSNIGHLEAAAGIAGLIKVILSLWHEEIPPHLHLHQPSPRIAWDELPIRVPTERVPWQRGARPRIAGVSSFGMSGANAHVLVEEAPPLRRAIARAGRPLQLLTLSAAAPEALAPLADRHRKHLEAHPSIELGDVAATLNAGRAHFATRTSIVAASRDEAIEGLQRVAAGQAAPRTIDTEASGPKIALLFTGQGSQSANMGRQLYETQPAFRQMLERCDQRLQPVLEQRLLDVLYPGTEHADAIHDTLYTQPALFAWEYALARLLGTWGVRPTAVLGHSIGQYVAATVAGVFGWEDGLSLVAERARLMQNLPQRGAMVAVLADEACVQEAIRPFAGAVSLAAVNGPRSTVISGSPAAIDEVVRSLAAAGLTTQRLNVSHAFHSPLIEPMLAPFERFAAGVRFALPTLELVSNVDGQLASDEVTTPQYWSTHTRRCVRFADGLTTLWQLGYRIFVEVGPRPTLSSLAARCLPKGQATILPCLRDGRDDGRQLLETLGQLYERGVPIRWDEFDRHTAPRRVMLPTYPFQRDRYWFESGSETDAPPAGGSDSPPAGPIEAQADARPAATGSADWLYELTWQPQTSTPPLSRTPAGSGTWLIFADASGVATRLSKLLESRREAYRLVFAGEQFQRISEQEWTLNPSRREDFERFWDECAGANGDRWRAIVHLWGCDAPPADRLSLPALEQAQQRGCGSVLHLLQTLVGRTSAAEVEHGGTHPDLPKLWLVTRDAVPGVGRPAPQGGSRFAQYPLWGMGKVISLEAPQVWGGMIDLPDEPDEEVLAALLAELDAAGCEDQVALRDGRRFVARLHNAPANLAADAAATLRHDATYLITGGLGALGLRVARWMADHGARHLCLTGRRPPREQARQMIEQWEAAGVRVTAVTADVSDEAAMQQLVARIASTMPPLKGVVHAAGVFGYQPLPDLDWETVQQVLRPKVAGSWAVHQATRQADLDFFVSFSSLASLWGSKGQAHYAAANGFPDALAHYRRSIGLPAMTINWGPWSEGGMVTDEARQWLERTGVRALDPDRAVELFGRLLSGPAAQVAVADVDWRTWKPLYEVQRRRPLLDDVAVAAAPPKIAAETPATSIRQQLEGVAPPHRRRQLLTRLQDEVAAVLGRHNGRRPDPQKGFFKLGMDSLMAVELAARLAEGFHADLPSTLVFEHANINRVAEYLAREVLRWEEDGLEAEVDPLPAEDEQRTDEDDDGALEDQDLAPLAERIARLESLIRET